MKNFFFMLFFLLLSNLLLGQNLNEPVYTYNYKQVVNDSVDVYTYFPIDYSAPDREEYTALNGICVEVKLIYFDYYVDRLRRILESKGYAEAGYNLYYGPYGFIRSKIEFTGNTTITFKMLK